MIPRYAKFLLKCYGFLFSLLVIFRTLAFILLYRDFGQTSLADIAYAFFMGWRFDNVIICATLSLPFITFTLNHFIIKVDRLQKIGAYPLFVLIPIIVLLQIIDLLYFEHFSVRITSVILNWVDDLSFTLKMVKDEPLWLVATAFLPWLMWLFVKPVKKWSEDNYRHPLIGKNNLLWGITSVLFLGLLFLGIRGRVAIKSPIREGTAYFSTNPTLNHLALNPVYTFFSSWVRANKYREKALRFMAQEEAVKIIEEEYDYQITPGFHPLTRKTGSQKIEDLNVVVIIMEGMSAYYTDYFKNPSWTPHLDQIKREGLEFTNAYSAGTHTYNGVWSTLFSYPAPFTVHPLKRDIIPKLNSFAQQFLDKKRDTYFFTTHDDQFDNMAGFVRQNGFKHVIHQAHYPPERVFSILGVPDHDMFEHALRELKEAHLKGRFFAALLTGSNHKPHIIPPELRAKFNSGSEKQDIVNYSDWALGEFLRKAASESWGQKTIFAFVADHGQTASNATPLDQILSYYHMPFVIWSPPRLPAQRIQTPVMQVDLIPTLLGILGGEWTNSTLGRDVLRAPRDWVYLGRDEAVCLLLANKLECETLDKSRSISQTSKSFWPTEKKIDEAQAWKTIKAELQMSDLVLRERLNFP